MRIGKYKISVLDTGTFGLDGGAMFGIIPKPLWNKTTEADSKNRIRLGGRCLLLQSESKTILVDTGIGNIWDEKFKAIYNVDQTENTLLNSLKEKNVEPDEITDVILTHLHFDHVGGAVRVENEKNVPAFSNAKYHVQKEQYKWAITPSDKDRGSFVKDTFSSLYEEGMFHFINGEQQFDNEIKLLAINGHTFAQQMVKLSDSSNTVLFCADLVPTAAHIPIPYVMGYDINPMITIEEKKIYLANAVDEEWKLVFGHDPINVCATIQKTERGFAVKEKFEKLV
ncbi:MAG: MBL fold metallo-hydrolase [Ignavibacteriae bacterium]|nr:MBL fold metallo-hydrolase [Ignavibacteriota bacterium]